MKFNNVCDNHCHSSHSFDGNNTPKEMLARANELGLKYITITDHCECEQYDHADYNYRVSSKKAYDDISVLKLDNQNLLLGIELGQFLQNAEAREDALKNRNYDFIIGSLHSLENKPDFYYWGDGVDVVTELNLYFDELIRMIDFGGFDTLAHLTYPLRYLRNEQGGFYTFDPFIERVKEVYGKLIHKGISLELNCSGLRQSIGEVLPNKSLLDLYKQMGGELITIGSDAHSCEDLGKGLGDGLEILSEIGFTHYATYINRKPNMIKII